MTTVSERPDPRAIELEARSLWAARQLPPPSGTVGPAEGPVVHQFLGSFAPQEAGMLAIQRVVAADVDARAIMLAGRRAKGILRREEGGPPTTTIRLGPLLVALGVWVGGSEGRAWEDASRRAEVQALVGRLAHLGALAVRDVSLRICPACANARSPDRIVYQEEDGDTLLVRFAFPYGDRSVSALVWSDAAWRLLGTSALMVHPDLPYVIARYRRHDVEELVFTSRSSLERIRGWLPGATFEILEEHPGRHWEGQAYVHPLRNEFPMGGGMEPPCGTILSVSEVGDSGTGVVPLVPGHGGTDTQIADRLRVPGWPLITPKGRFDILFVHKYAGLELESGNEFVARDLGEEGAIFARLRVRRGVPHCARCGTTLIWAPGRAWCLEPSRLPAEKVAIYRALLPRDRPIEKLEAVPWPVSEPQRSDDPNAIALLECTSCDRLEAPGTAGEKCECGGRRRTVRRRLLSGFESPSAAWASVDPFPAADSARLYVNERRRAPTVVHHIAAMSGVTGTIGEVRLTVLPTVPEVDLPGLISTHGADAVRAALVRAQASEGATATFADRCAQEGLRLASFWKAARDVLQLVDASSMAEFAQPIAGSLGELEPEDRALLARFERLRIQCLVDLERSAPGPEHRRLFQFLENDLVTYRAWVAPRLALEGNPPTKRAALHTLVHLISSATVLLGPIAPHTAEVVHRLLGRGRPSLFEEPPVGVDRALLDDSRVRAWDRWVSVIRAIGRFRRQVGVAPDLPLPAVVLVLDSDATADQFRADAPTVERLARIQRVEVAAPATPWTGRRRQLRPREAEIQRVYASRAAQIIHLLRRTPERKWADPTSGQEFSLIVNGQPTQILPSMISWVETLPERYVPVEWPAGELYAEVPGNATGMAAPPPPLSPDAFRLVARIGRRLRAAPADGPRVVVAAAPEALAAELSTVSEAIAKYLGLREFRVVTSDRELPQHHLEHGRTRSGNAWSFHLAGTAPPTRPHKARPMRSHGSRIRPAFSPAELVPTIRDYADEQFIAREGAVRLLGEELDEILGIPLLGPAKVGAAWDAGLRSLDAFRGAPWSTLVELPGFGIPLASALVTKFGGTVPPRPEKPRRARRVVLPEEAAGRPRPDAEPWRSSAIPAGRAASSPSEGPLPEVVPPHPTLALPDVEIRDVGSGGEASSAGATASTAGVAVSPEDIPLADSSVVAAQTTPPLPTLELRGSEPPVAVPSPPGTLTDEAPSPSVIEESVEDGVTASAGPDAAPPRTAAIDETQLMPESQTGAAPPALPVPEEPPLGEEALSGEPPTPGEDRLAAESAPETGPVLDLGTPGPDSSPTALPDGQNLPEPPSVTPVEESPSHLPMVASEPTGGEGSSTPVAHDLELEPQSAEAGADSVSPRPDEAELFAPAVSPSPSEPPSVQEAPRPSAEGPTPTSIEPAVATEPVTALSPPPAPAIAVAAPPDSTLKPALLAPPEPAPLLTPAPLPPPAGGIDLAVGPSYIPSLERFLEATAAGHQGICVVRDSPERLRAYIGSRPVEIRWLTNIGRGLTLKPSDLEGFAAFLAHAVSSGHVTAFFLEGMEYLIRLHGLDRVVERMQAFDTLAREHSARVWVPLNPNLLSPEERDRFVRAFGGRSPPP